MDYPAWIVEARALAEAPRRMVIGDDFATLEGIGPVYEAKLKHAGIATFAQLAATDEASLKEMIQAPAWRRVNYGEWIEQAKLAAAGDDEGLKALQAELFSRGGDNIGVDRRRGRKSAAALSAAGITTYTALAESTPEQVAASSRPPACEPVISTPGSRKPSCAPLANVSNARLAPGPSVRRFLARRTCPG